MMTALLAKVSRWTALGACALVAGALLTAPPHWSFAQSAPPVRGAAIDGSEDAPTTQTLNSATFSDIDAMGMRPKELTGPLIEIDEFDDIRTVERDGKPYKSLSFGMLAGFRYTLPGPGEMKRTDTEIPVAFRGQIPKRIESLHNEEVAIMGFIVPLEMERGRLKSFVLVRNQMMCCYGVIPEINEWIHVTEGIGGFRAPYIQDYPVRIYGKLEVGEVVRRGQVMSLYRLRVSGLEEVRDLR